MPVSAGGGLEMYEKIPASLLLSIHFKGWGMK